MAKSETTPEQSFLAAQEEFYDRFRYLAEVELIKSPQRWPRYPFLCFVHRKEKIDSLPCQGLMLEIYSNTVFTVNLYDIPMFGGSMTEKEFLEQRIAYESIDALLGDWKID